MKKILVLLTITSFSIACFSQKTTETVQVPVVNGKILFSDTINVNMSQAEIQTRISEWLTTEFLPDHGLLNSNDSILGLASCQVMDYLEIEKKALSVFAMYMRYNLILEFTDNRCIASVRNINFISSENMNSDDPRDRTDFFSGDFIMLEKKYKVAFVKNASERITAKAVERIHEIFATIDDVLQKK